MPNTPNELLRYWLHRAGWSNKELARQVHRLAEQSDDGYIKPSGTNVRHWLNGSRPHPPTHLLIARAFSQRFGFAVSAADLGMDQQVPSVLSSLDLPWHSRFTVEATDECVRADLMMKNRREAISEFAGVAVGAVLLDPLQAWLTATPEATRTQIDGQRIGMDDVAQVESVTEVFRGLDNQYGGGLHREAVVGQLLKTNDLIAHASYTAPVGRRLRVATADLCGLVAWMSFDSGRHRLAQRYWILGVHHAHDAGDRELAAFLLQEMAMQMDHLNRSEDALELARMAWYGANRGQSPHLRAIIGWVEALAYARLGRANEALTAMGRAEDDFARPALDSVPDRLAYVTEASLLGGGRGAVLRDLAATQDGTVRKANLERAQEATQAGIGNVGDLYPRSRARYLMDAVEIHQLAGEYDEATAVAERLAPAIAPISSRRTLEKIQAIRDRLGDEPKDRRVRELAEQLDRPLRRQPALT